MGFLKLCDVVPLNPITVGRFARRNCIGFTFVIVTHKIRLRLNFHVKTFHACSPFALLIAARISCSSGSASANLIPASLFGAI